MNKFVAISGCSGGGKSTLLEALRQRGYQVVEEPGRRIVIEEQHSAGTALPWVNPRAFAQRAIEISLKDLEKQQGSGGWVFFDRGLVDACSALASNTGTSIESYLEGKPRYHRTVFLTPPWEDIYITDAERTHSFAEATREYERLVRTYPDVGYEIVVLEKTTVERRTNAILDYLGEL